MSAIKDFLEINGIRQVDLAKYLDVTETAVSNYAKGKTAPSPENIKKLVENPFNWDITPLIGTPQYTQYVINNLKNGSMGDNSPVIINDSSSEIASLKNEIKMLREQLKEEKARSEKYWKRIEDLMDKLYDNK